MLLLRSRNGSTCVTVHSTAATRQAAVPLAPPEVLQAEPSHGMWHKGVHFVASEVRDYELDQFQVSCSSHLWPAAVVGVHAAQEHMQQHSLQHTAHSTAQHTAQHNPQHSTQPAAQHTSCSRAHSPIPVTQFVFTLTPERSDVACALFMHMGSSRPCFDA